MATPNRALRRLLAETGWTEQRLAQEVNTVAAEAGLVLRLDRSAVSHWLAGRIPRHPTPAFLAEALTRRLGRAITPADLGMAARKNRRPPAGAAGPEDPPSTLRLLAANSEGAGDSAASRRHAPSAQVYSLAALAVPPWTQAAPRHRLYQVHGSSGQRLRPGQVSAAEQMLTVFADADAAFGGGYARRVLAAYLAHDTAPCLRAPTSPALRSRMVSAATALAYLAGFMCFDDQEHGLAQRYYQVTLQLAVENDDQAAYAITVRAMSEQASMLGHHRQAARLAEIAAAISKTALPTPRRAFFLGQVAVTAAANGQRGSAISALRAAERHLTHTTQHPGARAGDHVADLHTAVLAHQQAAVLMLLGDRDGAIAALTRSLRMRPAHERRSRAIATARLAELHLTQGHLEEAIHTWHSFLDDYPYLTSGRATAALNTLRAQLRPYTASCAAHHLLTRATAVLHRPVPSRGQPPHVIDHTTDCLRLSAW
ncbi:hypothetical protein [Actinomadura sp. 9N215]|uniref:hypothetical protein n=1 Tax=Actinomadura sp. 9N215 TaxID=3375150 RepID=UPI0037A8210E